MSVVRKKTSNSFLNSNKGDKKMEKSKSDPFLSVASKSNQQKDYRKRENSTEMSSIGVNENPDILDELGVEDIDKMFISSQEMMKNKSYSNYEFISLTGKSFCGKTRLALSTSKMIPDLYKLELDKQDVLKMDKIFNKIPPANKIYVLGLEESTEDELFSSRGIDYYSNVDIKYKEMLAYNGNGSAYDYIETYNNFMRFIKSFQKSEIKDVTLVIDSMTPVLQAMHYILRAKIMKIDPMSKEQGVPQKYWFWRNQQMEGIMLMLKSMKVHKILTYKTAKGFKDDDEQKFIVKWHEETNYHISKTRVDLSILSQNNNIIYNSVFDKCRNNPSLYEKTFQNMNGCKMFLNIYGE